MSVAAAAVAVVVTVPVAAPSERSVQRGADPPGKYTCLDAV